MDVLQPYLQTV